MDQMSNVSNNEYVKPLCLPACVPLPVPPYLWQAEQQRQAPGQQNEAVPALSGHTAVRQQGAADGVMSVHRHGYDHVGGAEHSENLQVFHQATQEVRPRKQTFSIPHELRQHLGEGGREE